MFGIRTSFAALALCFLASSAAATAVVRENPPIMHCGGLDDARCPPGWRCCGPIQIDLGGTCHDNSVTLICPF
ncbi:hypothetical protein BDN72DRAFT_846293 [Pluteus cervinus]|uniref:Uncharacterized protein n=1 Tax=Pluteus cervinus TaxID=181527 RepID=A0ACD3AGX2_9AGAR|nr:hypothetical protein BDN72DRAFT_846293 [Pluteus cervinus]